MNVLALFVILRARSGALQAVAVVIDDGLVEWEPFGSVPGDMLLLLLAVVIAGVFGLFLTLYIGRWFASRYHRVPYRLLTKGIIVSLVVLVALFTGPVGLVVLAVGTCIGLLPPLVGVQRVHMMGCIVVPVVLYFLGV